MTNKPIMERKLMIELSNGETWSLPISVVAKHRAAYYAREFYGNLEESLQQDTIPLFTDDLYQIKDWFQNNMNWDLYKDELCFEDYEDDPDYEDLIDSAKITIL